MQEKHAEWAAAKTARMEVLQAEILAIQEEKQNAQVGLDAAIAANAQTLEALQHQAVSFSTAESTSGGSLKGTQGPPTGGPTTIAHVAPQMLETLYQRLVQLGFAHPQAAMEPQLATDLFKTAILDSGILASTMPVPVGSSAASASSPSSALALPATSAAAAAAGTIEAEETAAKKFKSQAEDKSVP